MRALVLALALAACGGGEPTEEEERATTLPVDCAAQPPRCI